MASKISKYKQPERIIYGAVWFTAWGNIGIVAMNNGFEDKAYIGVVSGDNEEQDIKDILAMGSSFPFKQAIEIIGRNGK